MSALDTPARPVDARWAGRLLLDDLRRHPGVTAAVMATFALGASLFGAYRLAAAPAPEVTPAARPRAAVLVYLRDDFGPAAEQALRRALVGLPGVDEVKRVAPADALSRMRQQLGAHARLLDGAEDGLLPASIEIGLGGGASELRARAAELARRLQSIDGVTDVDIVVSGDVAASGGDEAARRRAVALGLWSLAAAATTAALAGALALRRSRRRAETRLMLALGFTRASAFLPAVASVVAAALGGAALGLAALRAGGVLLARGWLPGTAHVFVAVPLLSPLDCGLALVAALGLGAVAGYLTVRVPDPADAL